MTTIPALPLRDGTTIPALGLGVYKVDDATAEPAVATAIDAGYRLIDTATLYRNERGVGRALRAAPVPRDAVYLTTKLWNDAHGRPAARRAFDESVERLGGPPDLYLIHWPCPARGLYAETWRALLELRDEGRVRSVGVSNFQRDHLETIIADSGEVPVLNQIELHPYLQQRELRAVHADLGIVTQAWSPLGRGAVLADPTIGQIAAEHGVTPAHVILRWHLDLGIAVIPKSVTPERIRANLDVFALTLTERDHDRIAGLDRGARSGSHPDEVN
ncbi:aldo/keto reductase [Cellulomonas edaphi]|uniref:Aldo/keto reductase n=1 Tax=Cellulomonas edaphi TaxID=3053468 RepID=A0ABT7S665_9CELL|nr:aldo/keto reductase [Cellulomons edaphi]MDM7831081.1 aldo/keto reductase [Cellulomons edaphi]